MRGLRTCERDAAQRGYSGARCWTWGCADPDFFGKQWEAALSKFPHFIRLDEVDRQPPREIRTWAQVAIIEKRNEMRKQVMAKKLRQQGLSQHAAEERVWRLKP